MYTRRNFLGQTLAAGVLAGGRPAFATAPQPSTRINFDVPRHACDCHAIVIADSTKFPFSPNRTFTPDTALPDELKTFHKAIHVERVLILTTSIYGTDNTSTLWALKSLGKNARGVALIDDSISDSALDEMGKGGMCGMRLLLPTMGPQDRETIRQRFDAAVKRVQNRNWHIQMYIDLAAVPAIKDFISRSPMPVVFDHFAGVEGSIDRHPAFPALLELIGSGKVYVKFAGEDLEPAVAPGHVKLIAANPDRVLWGSDWPHMPRFTGSVASGRKATDVIPHTRTDDGRLFNLFPTWVPNPAVRKKILVDNPARIYGF